MSHSRAILAVAFILSCAVWRGVASADMAGHGGHGAGMATGGWGVNDDVKFLSGMIVHHVGAIDMAKAVVDTARDPAVRGWAREIIDTQRVEISTMQSILDKLKTRDEAAEAAMRREMQAMLATKADPDPEVNFVMQMIPHHAGAIEMSVPALAGTGDPIIRNLAGGIIVAQTNEIEAFRDWLDQRAHSGQAGGH